VVKQLFSKLLPWLSLIAGGLGFVFIPRDLMDIGNAFGDWVRLLPFGPEALPRILFLSLMAYGTWRIFMLYAVPPFAHRLHPWKNDRISLVEFARIARAEYGWRLPGSLEILDLIDGVGQALADGAVRGYGRFNPERYSNLRALYLVPIPRTYWRRRYLDAFDALNLEDNLQVVSRRYGDRDRLEYIDIHVNRIQARAWLAQEGEHWKGQTERKDEERKKGAGIAIAAE
jgi:hypothetical protein